MSRITESARNEDCTIRLPMVARISKKCRNCDSVFSVPPCRDWREHCCSTVCKIEYRQKQSLELRAARTRHCERCGNQFIAKKSQLDVGDGRFCSVSCGGVGRAKSVELRIKIANGNVRAITEGRKLVRSGASHPQWSGGKVAARRRRTASGKGAAKNRSYRAANQHKVREWAQNRRGRKTGRLTRGFVARLFALQRGCCAACCVKLVAGYHVDHVVALAAGGKHEDGNIQLLCATCNVRKGAKDPIRFMQERGYLL